MLKSGGTYLPLDPKFPKDRLEFMAGGLGGLAAPDAFFEAESLPETSAPRGSARPREESLSKAPGDEPRRKQRSLAFAYLIYTSGSTGKPKGVMVPRRALINFLLSMAETPGMAASDTLLAVTTDFVRHLDPRIASSPGMRRTDCDCHGRTGCGRARARTTASAA